MEQNKTQLSRSIREATSLPEGDVLRIRDETGETLVVSFSSGKGGVGKTTSAVNFAACLARVHGQRVLLIDADPQNSAKTIIEKFNDEERGLRLDPGFDYGTLTQLQKGVFDISFYDVLVVDTPPGVDEKAQKIRDQMAPQPDGSYIYTGKLGEVPASMPLLNSDIIIMPVQPSALDVDSTFETDRMYRQIYPDAHIHWLWNRVDKNSTFSASYAGVLNDIKKSRAMSDKERNRLDMGKARGMEGLPPSSVIYNRSAFSEVLEWYPHLFFDEADLVNDENFRGAYAGIMDQLGLDSSNTSDLNRYCYKRAVSFKEKLKDSREMIDSFVHDVFTEVGLDRFLQSDIQKDYETLN